ncbi:MAG: cell division protein ZapD [Sedimenticola sp.]|nr:MAG: cell division protein ZapD [Sedimenticola sp.]
MPSTASEKIIYEHPLNEKTRTILRLEHLFRESAFHLPKPDVWSSRAAITALLDMVSIFARADIKADLIKELDRHKGKLNSMRQTPGIDTERLNHILRELDEISGRLYRFSGQIGQEIRENEFLKSIMQRSSIPGGSCDFDLPIYHYWLEQPHEYRQAEITHWLKTLTPIDSAVELLLSLIRGSTTPTKEIAEQGFFQKSLDAQSPAQLIRVGLPKDARLVAEISGGKHRFSIRFLTPEENERPSPVKDDVPFSLNCCIL